MAEIMSGFDISWLPSGAPHYLRMGVFYAQTATLKPKASRGATGIVRASSREMKSHEMPRDADENSENGRTGNSWSLLWWSKFRRHGTPCLHCFAFFFLLCEGCARPSAHEPVTLALSWGVVEQDVHRGTPAGVAAIHPRNGNSRHSYSGPRVLVAKGTFVARVTQDRRPRS